MHVEAVSASFSHPLPPMLFSLSLFFLTRPDLLGFGLYLMRKTYPFAFLGCDSQIRSPTDLSLYKDIYSTEKDLLCR